MPAWSRFFGKNLFTTAEDSVALSRRGWTRVLRRLRHLVRIGLEIFIDRRLVVVLPDHALRHPVKLAGDDEPRDAGRPCPCVRRFTAYVAETEFSVVLLHVQDPIIVFGPSSCESRSGHAVRLEPKLLGHERDLTP
jgi:hypothetical protein